MTKLFDDSLAFSKKFEPDVIARLAPKLIAAPPIEEDQERNTDLWLTAKTKRISYRIRRFGFGCDKYDDFTLRYSTPHTGFSEYSKILMGHGDWFFYGVCNEDESGLLKWRLYDLELFRKYVSKAMELNGPKWLPGELKSNFDQTKFIIIKDNVAFKIDWGE